MAVNKAVIEWAIDSKEFTFKDGVFVAEASDVNGDMTRQIYDDAVDIGFAMKSSKTGTIVKYYLEEEKKDADGDVQSWTFKPCSDDVRKTPSCANTKVVVFND